MAEIKLKINGMSCQHCVMSVQKAIEGINGVHSLNVSIGSAEVSFDESKTDIDAIKESVIKAGYSVVD